MLLVGCLVAAAPEPEADVEFLSDDAGGLKSAAEEGLEAGVRTGVSEADRPSAASVGPEPLLVVAEEIFRQDVINIQQKEQLLHMINRIYSVIINNSYY